MIRFCDIHKSFGSNIVLDGINFEIYPNEITAIVGPNGMGKTTILNLICGMFLPDYGTIKYENCSSKSCFVVLSGDNSVKEIIRAGPKKGAQN